MDRDRMLKLHQARTAQIEAGNENLPEAQRAQVEELKTRYKALCDRMAPYVGHKHYSPDFSGDKRQRQISGSRHIGTFDGPMPEVYVRFVYYYEHPDFVPWANSGGVGLNEFGENIITISAEFIHHPPENTSGVHEASTYVPINMNYGEIFATEAVSFGDIEMLETEAFDSKVAEEYWGYHPSAVLTLLEESMDQFEAAPPSAYEIREGLVAV